MKIITFLALFFTTNFIFAQKNEQGSKKFILLPYDSIYYSSETITGSTAFKRFNVLPATPQELLLFKTKDSIEVISLISDSMTSYDSYYLQKSFPSGKMQQISSYHFDWYHRGLNPTNPFILCKKKN